MYRKWVFVRFGRLGKGNRVRIPPCVVEFIRARYREPGCACLPGGPLYACTAHGYTGQAVGRGGVIHHTLKDISYGLGYCSPF